MVGMFKLHSHSMHEPPEQAVVALGGSILEQTLQMKCGLTANGGRCRRRSCGQVWQQLCSHLRQPELEEHAQREHGLRIMDAEMEAP